MLCKLKLTSVQIISYNWVQFIFLHHFLKQTSQFLYTTYSSVKPDQILSLSIIRNCICFACGCFWPGYFAFSNCMWKFHLPFKTQFKCQLFFGNLSRSPHSELIILFSGILQFIYAFIKQLFIEFSRRHARYYGERNLDEYFTVNTPE